MKYAAQTTVPVERSRAEIEHLLTRYGADQFVSGWDQEKAMIGFRVNGRFVRFKIVVPKKDDNAIVLTSKGRRRSKVLLYKVWEQLCRQRWRALCLVIKAKLEAVASGVTSFENEFLPHIMIPGGQTVGEWVKPQLDAAYASGKMPKGLPGIGETFGSKP